MLQFGKWDQLRIQEKNAYTNFTVSLVNNYKILSEI